MTSAATSEPVLFESGHADQVRPGCMHHDGTPEMLSQASVERLIYHLQVHDVQFDYYGRRLATCSSDRTIKVSFRAYVWPA